MHNFEDFGYCGKHYEELVEHSANIKIDMARLSQLVEEGHAFEKHEIQFHFGSNDTVARLSRVARKKSRNA